MTASSLLINLPTAYSSFSYFVDLFENTKSLAATVAVSSHSIKSQPQLFNSKLICFARICTLNISKCSVMKSKTFNDFLCNLTDPCSILSYNKISFMIVKLSSQATFTSIKVSRIVLV